MSTTDNDGGTPSGREPEERPSQRLHGLYRADLRPFERVSDAQLLGAIDRAEVHDEHDHPSPTTHMPTPTRRRGSEDDAACGSGTGGSGHNSTRSGPPGASAMFAAMD
jgi:hypothetical protein